MKTQLFIASVLILAQSGADPLPQRAVTPDNAGAVRVWHAGMQRPLGIEGNGQPLGIEGNGVIQRTGQDGVVVNDTLFAFDAATVKVTIDDRLADATDIVAGQVARVAVSGGMTAAATNVHIDNLIRGPIDAGGVDPAASTVTVLGQTLVIPEFAELGDASGDLDLEDLADGDYLRIGGFANEVGDVLATRLERTASTAVLEVSGRVDALNNVRLTLRIGALTIDVATAQFIGLTVQDLALGDRLEVIGEVVTGSGALLAQRVRRLPVLLGAPAGLHAELQGVVTSGPVNGRFDLAGTTVWISAATEYERGVAADIQPGRIVEVEGSFDGNDVLVAARVEFDEEPLESEIRVSSLVTSVDVASSQFGILGLQATVDVATRMEDKTDSGTPFVDIGDIVPGQFVELRAYDEPDGSFMLAATRVTREMPDEALLRGRVDTASGGDITVLGRAVQTTPQTEYSDSADNPISASEFFAAAQPGVLVKARGTATANGIEAARLDLE